jgi:hypothetical protein
MEGGLPRTLSRTAVLLRSHLLVATRELEQLFGMADGESFQHDRIDEAEGQVGDWSY